MKKLPIFIASFVLLSSQCSISYAQTYSQSLNASVPATLATISGIASPNALLYITENDAIDGTTASDQDGNFTITLSGQSPSNHTYTIYSQDANNITSNSTSITTSLQPFINNQLAPILLPTSLQITGSTLLSGLTIPNGYVNLFITSIPVIHLQASETGSWSEDITKLHLPNGTYNAYANESLTKTASLISDNSLVVAFSVNQKVITTVVPNTTSLSTPTQKTESTQLESKTNIQEVQPSQNQITKSFTPTSTIQPTINQIDIPVLKILILDQNNKPLRGILVTLHSVVQTAITDDSGYASFSNVPLGEHSVSFAYNGETITKSIQVTKTNEKGKIIVSIPVKPNVGNTILLFFIVVLIIGISCYSFLQLRKRKKRL